MKKKEKIEDLTQEQMSLVEDFCKMIDLGGLALNEQIAINYLFNKKFTKYPLSNIVNDAYPNTNCIGGGGMAGSPRQDIQILIALFSLKRDLEISTKQSTLIEQNKTIIKQNQEVINLLKEIKDK